MKLEDIGVMEEVANREWRESSAALQAKCGVLSELGFKARVMLKNMKDVDNDKS